MPRTHLIIIRKQNSAAQRRDYLPLTEESLRRNFQSWVLSKRLPLNDKRRGMACLTGVLRAVPQDMNFS